MNVFRTIIIIAIFGLILLIGFFFLSGGDTNSDTIPNPVDVSSSGTQIVTPIKPDAGSVTVTDFEPTSAGYEIREFPTSGLVNSVINVNPSEEFDEVQKEIFLDVFWVLECTVPDGSIEKVLMLTAQPSLSPNGGDILRAKAAIRDWEPKMARDLGSVLFPATNSLLFETTNLGFENYNIDSRFAEFTVNENSYQIHYGWVLNFAVFATSHNCLVAAINDTYAPWAH